MTLQEIDQLIDSDHDLASKVGKTIKAAAKVGPTDMEMQVDMGTLETVAECLGLTVNRLFLHGGQRAEIVVSFLEVDAVIYARVQR